MVGSAEYAASKPAQLKSAVCAGTTASLGPLFDDDWVDSPSWKAFRGAVKQPELGSGQLSDANIDREWVGHDVDKVGKVGVQ